MLHVCIKLLLPIWTLYLRTITSLLYLFLRLYKGSGRSEKQRQSYSYHITDVSGGYSFAPLTFIVRLRNSN